MKRTAINLSILLTGLALLGSTVLAQAPAPGTKEGPKEEKKKADAPKLSTLKLEEMLDRALKNNPDIRVAESKVREAEAELNRTRLQVMQKVVKLQQELAVSKALVEQAQANLDRTLELQKARQISQAEVTIAKQMLQQAKANLAKVEADFPYLLGQPAADPWRSLSRIRVDETLGVWQADLGRFWDLSGQAGIQFPGHLNVAKETVSRTSADKIRQALDLTVKANFEGTVPVQDVLNVWQETAKGVNLTVGKSEMADVGVQLRLTQPVALGAALQWFEDTQGWRVVIRDYGIVLTEAHLVPPGALLLKDFWKNEPAAPKKSPSK
jgi:hypothetical protein